MKELAEIQQKLKAPKGQYNNFGKYNYRSCEDILEAVKPLLDGCTLTLSDDVVEVGGRVFVKAIATLKNDQGEGYSVTAFAREPENKKGMDESQITGAASSYARKYALNGLFAIDDAVDSDVNESPAVITEEQVIKIKDFLTHDNCNEVDLLKWAGVEKVEDIPASKYDMAIAGLAKRVANA